MPAEPRPARPGSLEPGPLEPGPLEPAASRRRAQTRARLLDAAQEVFAEKGLKVTVDDLVSAAGFTRGAFYSNFSSLEEVFFALFERQSTAMLRAVHEVIEAVPAGEFSLESVGLILESLHPYGRQWYLIQTEFVLLALRNEDARAVFAAHHQTFHHQLVDVIGEVITRLGREPVIPLEQVTETAVALYLHSLAQEHLGAGSLGPQELVEVVIPQVLLGLSRPAARG